MIFNISPGETKMSSAIPTESYVKNGRTVTPKRECFLVISGVAPRCRKPDTHVIKLGFRPIEQTPMQPSYLPEVMTEAKTELAKYKAVTSARLKLHYTEVGDGFRSSMLMDDRHISIKLV
jgi:hypothetical protein